MDIALRARHDALVNEFTCAATQFRIVRTVPGSGQIRNIEAFCNEPRAERFGNVLPDYATCCAPCQYLAHRTIEADDPSSSTDLMDIEDLPA